MGERKEKNDDNKTKTKKKLITIEEMMKGQEL